MFCFYSYSIGNQWRVCLIRVCIVHSVILWDRACTLLIMVRNLWLHDERACTCSRHGDRHSLLLGPVTRADALDAPQRRWCEWQNRGNMHWKESSRWFFSVSPRQTEQHLVLGLSFQWKTDIDEKFNRNLLPKKSFTVCRIVSVNFCVIYINELHLFKRDNALPFDFAGVVASFLNSYEQCFQTNQYFIN